MIANSNGNGDDGARFHFCALVHFAEETLIFTDVCDNNRLAMLRDPARKALSHLNANIFESLCALTDGEFEIKFLARIIDEKKRPGVGAQKFVNFLHDGAKNLIELKGTGECF